MRNVAVPLIGIACLSCSRGSPIGPSPAAQTPTVFSSGFEVFGFVSDTSTWGVASVCRLSC
jgi:hypothetical protein